MTPSALDVYQRGLSAVLRAPDHLAVAAARPYRVRGEDGWDRPLELAQWSGATAPADEAVLDRARGPVLDVGCGPGRHVTALLARGVPALGIDVAPVAVQIARRRGAPVHLGSVFDEVPGHGHWATALLLDGNLGIGGDPRALLRRVRSLLAPDGRVLVEPDPPGALTAGAQRARLVGPEGPSQWFAWARVPADRLWLTARDSGLLVEESWRVDGRWFARLARAAD